MDDSEKIRVLERKLAEAEAARQAAAQDVAYYKHLLQGSALKSILLGELPEQARIDAFLRQYGIHFGSNCFMVALLLPDSEHYLRSTGLPQNYESLKEMGRIVEETCEKYLPCHRTTIQMKFALIIPVKDITKSTAAQTRRIVSDCNRRMTKIVQELASEHSISCKASISFPVKGVHWLFWAFDHAKTLMENLNEKEYICGYDRSTNGPRMKPTTAERSRFFFEQCFYTACISHDNIQACQVLGSWFRQEAQNAGISFSHATWLLQRYMTFLLNTMNISLYEPHNEMSIALVQCYIDLNKCFTFDDVAAVLDRFSELVSHFTDKGILESSSDAKANVARAYIEAHFAEPDLTVESVCEQLQMSRAGLSKIFKSKTGVTLLEYIHQQRIERAKRLIREGIPLDEAASSCGYYSRRSLTEVFKKYEGMTPSDYRRDAAQEG